MGPSLNLKRSQKVTMSRSKCSGLLQAFSLSSSGTLQRGAETVKSAPYICNSGSFIDINTVSPLKTGQLYSAGQLCSQEVVWNDVMRDTVNSHLTNYYTAYSDGGLFVLQMSEKRYNRLQQ